MCLQNVKKEIGVSLLIQSALNVNFVILVEGDKNWLGTFDLFNRMYNSMV